MRPKHMWSDVPVLRVNAAFRISPFSGFGLGLVLGMNTDSRVTGVLIVP